MRSATARTSSMLWLTMTTAEPAFADPFDEVEHLGGLRDAERRGRFVEHDDLGVQQQRPRDRDGLALPARQRRRSGCARWGCAPRARATAPTSGPPSRSRPDRSGREFLAEEQVRDDVEVLAQREVLEDRRDAEGEWRRWGRCQWSHGVPSNSHHPRGSGAWTPARTFTSVDLPAPLSPTRATTSPGAHVEVDVGERGDGAEVSCTRRAGDSTGVVDVGGRAGARPACRTRWSSVTPGGLVG